VRNRDEERRDGLGLATFARGRIAGKELGKEQGGRRDILDSDGREEDVALVEE
jgi:hypothetical protein